MICTEQAQNKRFQLKVPSIQEPLFHTNVSNLGSASKCIQVSCIPRTATCTSYDSGSR